MARQTVAPALRKIFFLSTQFYSGSSLTLPAAFIPGGPGLAGFNGVPVNIMGGYLFGMSAWGGAGTGTFSPHSIITPSKDTVDLQVDVWWMGTYRQNAADPKDYNVGWLCNMQMTKDATPAPLTPPYSLLLGLTGIGGPAPAHPLGEPLADTVDSEGHINWNYNQIEVGKSMKRPYPLDQWAVGFERQAMWDGIDPTFYPALPICFYRTPLRMIKKVNGVLTTDDTYTFKNFSAMLEDTPVGVMFNVFRAPAASDGDLQASTFGTDTHPAEFSDAITFLGGGGIELLAPIFIGLELTIL